MKTLRTLFAGILFLSVITVGCRSIPPADSSRIHVKNGDRIAFLGDSITRLGDSRGGYINWVIYVLNVNGINAVKIPAGVDGNKAPDLLARLDADVLAHKPTMMTLSCGVNDVWHADWGKGVPLDEYKKNITEIVDKAQQNGIRVYIMTATLMGESTEDHKSQKLVAYNDFLRSLAKEKNCVLVDVNAAMRRRLDYLHAKNPDCGNRLLTYDGIHMNPAGDILLAAEILRGFGLTDSQIVKGFWQ